MWERVQARRCAQDGAGEAGWGRRGCRQGQALDGMGSMAQERVQVRWPTRDGMGEVAQGRRGCG